MKIENLKKKNKGKN